MTEKLETIFWIGARPAIKSMYEAGMSEALIAAAVLDIRAAAITAERLRQEHLFKHNPPIHPRFSEVLSEMREWGMS